MQLGHVPDSRHFGELIEHLSRQIQGASYAHDLKPAQWSALRYYARASKTARTIQAFAVHASSHSAASQIVTGLKRKRLLMS